MADIKKGSKVEWSSAGGKSEGKVEKIVTKPSKEKVGSGSTRNVKASKDDPQAVVKSEKSGKKAVHKVDSLKKK